LPKPIEALQRPMALSVESVRQEMLRGLLIPRDIVNEALRTTASKLKAKETKFFAHKGIVTDSKEVEDHTTQLAAADQIYSLSGLYARERAPVHQTPETAIEVDLKTGVMRIVVGGQMPINTAPPEGLGTDTGPSFLSEPSAREGEVEASPRIVEMVRVEKPKKVPVPAALYKIILDEIVD